MVPIKPKRANERVPVAELNRIYISSSVYLQGGSPLEFFVINSIKV